MTVHLVGTPLSPDLYAEVESTVALLRSEAPVRVKADAADELIFRIVEAGLDYHFRDPALRFGLSPLLVRVVDVAAGTTLRALKAAARRVLRGLEAEHFAAIADALEERIYAFERADE